MTRRVAQLAVLVSMCLGAGMARAQSAPSCAFEAGTLTVTIDGISATLTASGAGAIGLDGVACGQATTTTTDLIEVNGGALADKVTLTGTFAPGATAEPSGTSEIEIALALGGGRDTLAVKYGSAADTVTFTAGGIDAGGDGDEDLATAGVEVVSLMTRGGGDTIDARAYLGGGLLVLDGGGGPDVLYGSAVRDRLLGGAGNDTLWGGNGNDVLVGGDGDDVLRGENGGDRMAAGAAVDGADRFHGGGGHDTVDYSARANPVSVAPDDWSNGNGEPGEGDVVSLDVEEVEGGAGDDSMRNNEVLGGPIVFRGNGGNDQLLGGPFDDVLYGGSGDDVLWDTQGDDEYFGDDGSDWFLHMDQTVAGNDTFHGGAGIDILDYGNRLNGVTVTIGNGLADDGEPGIEFDLVDADIEDVSGARGDNVLVGSAVANELTGLDGDDEIYGGGGDDILLGDSGNDLVVGDAGNDVLRDSTATTASTAATVRTPCSAAPVRITSTAGPAPISSSAPPATTPSSMTTASPRPSTAGMGRPTTPSPTPPTPSSAASSDRVSRC